MKNIFKNWKTTSSGIITAAGGVLLLLHDKTKTMEALTAVLAGIGLIFAHDGAGGNSQPPTAGQ